MEAAIPTAKNQGTITVMQDGVGKNPSALKPPPRPPDGMAAGASRHAAGAVGGNGVWGGGTIVTPP